MICNCRVVNYEPWPRTIHHLIRSHCATIRLTALLSVLFAGSCGQVYAAGLLQGWPAGPQLELRDHSVSVEIEDRIAVTEVTQVFQNNGNSTVEALYVFPLPPGASVANFSMWIDGKEMVGEVVERQSARQIYESYKPKGRDPGLLEKTGDNRFEMRIFPIGPGASQKIRLRYYQELVRQGNRLLYVYPLKIDEPDQKSGREYLPNSRRTDKFVFSLSVSSSHALACVESLTHGTQLKSERRSDREWSASLEATGIELDRDLSVCLTPKQPLPSLDVIASKVGNADGFFRLAITTDVENQPKVGGQDFVFLVDVSGSMGDEARLPRAREMINATLRTLGPADRFDIVSFSNNTKALFGSAKPTDATALQQAGEFLAGLEPKGSAYLDPALELANMYQQGEMPLKIVLVSDGIFDLDDPAWIFKRVSAFSKLSRLCYTPLAEIEGFTMLQQLLTTETGWTQPVPTADIKTFILNLAGQLTRPILYVPTLEFSGTEVYDIAPAILPCLHSGETVTVYGRYRSGGALTATLRGVMGNAPIKQHVQTILPAASNSKGNIERLWACRRVEDLVGLSHSQTDKAQQDTLWQIVRLGEAYSIVTDYTSFLVLENNEEYRRWQVERSNLLRCTSKGEDSADLRLRLEALQGKVQELSKEREKSGTKIQAIDSPFPTVKGKSRNTLLLELPKPVHSGTPKDIRAKNLRKPGPPRPREIAVAPGTTIYNVALHKPVTSSEREPIIGEIKQVTDGIKSSEPGDYVELGPGKQWVQIDLGEEHLIRFILLWHNYYCQRVYHDVIVQVSNDKTFEKGVMTLLNNDYDNSSGLGIGKDEQYIESYQGELITVKTPVRARYVRLYGNGNTDNQLNTYVEVEVFAASREQ